MKNVKINIKSYIPVLVILVIIVGVVVLSTSFGFFEYLKKSTTVNKITTANLMIEVNDKDSLEIASENSLPVYDEVGKSTKPYTFTLNNLSGVSASYEIRLIDDAGRISQDNCGDIQIPKEDLKYELKRENMVVSEGLLSSLDNNVIDTGVIPKTNDYSYELRIWIDSKAGSEITGKHFHGKIEVGVEGTNNE